MIYDDYPLVQISHRLDQVRLCRGNTLTVYLTDGKFLFDSKETCSIQVELRVTRNGVPQIFADGIKLLTFKEWQDMEGLPK
jgi:hypothetical protein